MSEAYDQELERLYRGNRLTYRWTHWNPYPRFVPFPRVARFLDAVTEARWRLREACAILRHGHLD